MERLSRVITTKEDAKEALSALSIVIFNRLEKIKTFVPPVNNCTKCSGTGIIIDERRHAPNMVSTMERKCGFCSGPPDFPDSLDKVTLDLFQWRRTRSAIELALIDSTFAEIKDAVEVAALVELLQTLEI